MVTNQINLITIYYVPTCNTILERASTAIDRPSLCQIGRVRRTQAVVAALSQREYLASSNVESQLNKLGTK